MNTILISFSERDRDLLDVLAACRWNKTEFARRANCTRDRIERMLRAALRKAALAEKLRRDGFIVSEIVDRDALLRACPLHYLPREWYVRSQRALDGANNQP